MQRELRYTRAVVRKAPVNLLEQEAERLKSVYGSRYHKLIEHNLKWVSEGMSAGGVAVQEGLIALSRGLPQLRSRIRKSKPYKRDPGKS